MSISELIGKTFEWITVNDDKTGINFRTDDGKEYKMWHRQDCCECVQIEDINGDLQDLIGSPILQAEESVSENADPKPKEYSESWTWTFYKLATAKGYVTLRWLGESNGYYGEEVDLVEIGSEEDW